ncbi:MAG: helix-turn-helix domain-containing protein [Bacteroidetes bacterium]|nr:helix-turn-helix domain-containing protein [Bacteroidota bacterium]
MKLKPIKTEKEYNTYLNWVDGMFDKKIKPNTAEGENLQVVLLLIKDYEDRHYAIPIPNPVAAIKLKMEERGLRSKDLEPYIGNKSYVSQILSGKKPLTLSIVKALHKFLGIPAEILLA